MINKYLEKIAKALSPDEKKSRSRAWGTYGRSFGYGAVGGVALPVVGGVAGGIYGYRQGLKKHAPHVDEKDLTSHAVKGYARAQGRSLVEGVGGAAAGGAVGAGGGALLSKIKKFAPRKAKDAAQIGGVIGGSLAGSVGAIHGAYKSTKNKLDELHKKK